MELITFFASVKVPVTVLHVLAVIVGMGAALMSDILFNFYTKDKRLDGTEIRTLKILSSVVWYGLIVICLSGAFLFAGNPEKYLASHKFLAKITILAVLLFNGYMLNAFVWKRLIKPGFFTAVKESRTRKIAFVGGAISVISWLAVCALGVLDKSPASYLVIVGMYALVVVFGSIVAVILENKEFEQKKK